MKPAGRLHSTGDLISERYEVLGYVGAGGMQEVYKARDRTLERDVALKHPKTVSAERRFKNSAKLSARVNHPNAAKTLDYVEADSVPYLVEEFIDGEDLHQVREKLPIMDPYVVAHLFHHIARGVAASHHADVVHRDLKPSNIMVSSDFSFSVIKVTDFGIAKMAEVELVEAVEGGEDTLTNSQTVMGAIPYMAPEMINDPGDSDKAADIWAVGAICFELLSGLKPFGKGLKIIPQILARQLVTFPQRLRKPQFDGLVTELLAIIDRCLVVDRTQRVAADELVTLLGALCYPDASRNLGTVESMKWNKWGFIAPASGRQSVFFHTESVYGDAVRVGDQVCFAAYDGTPNARAHPVLKLADEDVE